MRISDWTSDVCSSDLRLDRLCLLRVHAGIAGVACRRTAREILAARRLLRDGVVDIEADRFGRLEHRAELPVEHRVLVAEVVGRDKAADRPSAAPPPAAAGPVVAAVGADFAGLVLISPQPPGAAT